METLFLNEKRLKLVILFISFIPREESILEKPYLVFMVSLAFVLAYVILLIVRSWTVCFAFIKTGTPRSLHFSAKLHIASFVER